MPGYKNRPLQASLNRESPRQRITRGFYAGFGSVHFTHFTSLHSVRPAAGHAKSRGTARAPHTAHTPHARAYSLLYSSLHASSSHSHQLPLASSTLSLPYHGCPSLKALVSSGTSWSANGALLQQ